MLTCICWHHGKSLYLYLKIFKYFFQLPINNIHVCFWYFLFHRALEPGTYIKRSATSLASSHRCGPAGVGTSGGSNGGLASRDRLAQTTMTISFGLTAIGILWSIVSVLSTMACSIGLFMPYWMRGTMLNGTIPVHFGVFRRCNYPTSPNNYVFDCGHYTTFTDIPTLTWKICTIVIGLACIASMFVGLTSLLACCMRDLVTRKVGKVCGVIQFFSGRYFCYFQNYYRVSNLFESLS